MLRGRIMSTRALVLEMRNNEEIPIAFIYHDGYPVYGNYVQDNTPKLGVNLDGCKTVLDIKKRLAYFNKLFVKSSKKWRNGDYKIGSFVVMAHNRISKVSKNVCSYIYTLEEGEIYVSNSIIFKVKFRDFIALDYISHSENDPEQCSKCLIGAICSKEFDDICPDAITEVRKKIFGE